MDNVIPFHPKPKLARGERPKRRTDADILADMGRKEANGSVVTQPWDSGEFLDTPEKRELHAKEMASLLAHAKSGEPQVNTKELADYLQTKEAWDGEPKGAA